MKKSVKSCIGYIGQIPKNRDVRTFEKSAPLNVEHLVEISKFQHPETLTPSSILVFQGALDATSFRFVYMVPKRLFQKSVQTRVV